MLRRAAQRGVTRGTGKGPRRSPPLAHAVLTPLEEDPPQKNSRAPPSLPPPLTLSASISVSLRPARPFLPYMRSDTDPAMSSCKGTETRMSKSEGDEGNPRSGTAPRQ